MQIRTLLLIVAICFVGCFQPKQAVIVEEAVPYPTYDYDKIDATHFEFHVTTSKDYTETTFYVVPDPSQLDDGITYIWYGYVFDELEDDERFCHGYARSATSCPAAVVLLSAAVVALFSDATVVVLFSAAALTGR